METAHLVDGLPIEQRLALAYAPRGAREATLGLFALDAALAGVVRAAREPMLGQLRLAWWRDELGKPPAERAQGEPVLGLLNRFADLGRDLQQLVDGWELLLGNDPLTGEALSRFARARGDACAALARALGASDQSEAARRCGYEWALAELGTRLHDSAERDEVLALAAAADWQPIRLARSLRPILVLHRLAIRSRAKTPLLARKRDMLFAFRLGMIGV